MATYYVSPSGNDANNGLSADASHASNKPWLTIAKALGAAGIASGDTVYLGPGTYREVVSVAMTSATGETSVLGDPNNAQSFKDGSGVLLDVAPVRWTAYTTNDTTAPSTTANLTLAGRDFLTFKFIEFVGGGNTTTGTLVRADTNTSTNIKFVRCTFISGTGTVGAFNITNAANTALHWLFDSCSFLNTKNNNHIIITLTTHTSDYDSDFIIQNCLFIGGSNAVNITNSNSGGGSGGGVLVYNCTLLAQGVGGVRVSSTGAAQTFPCKTENCVIVGPLSTGGVTTGTGGAAQHTENRNYILGAVARVTVSAGANSISDGSYAPLFEIGQWMVRETIIKPLFSPLAGSPILGFGNTAAAPAIDILQRPRPSGGGSTSNAAGCFERHDFGAREASTVDASTYALKLTGPGDHDFLIPVDAAATVITVRVRYDTNHAATNKPQAILLARAEIGVSTETKTAAAAVDTWETLTFSSFTPSAKGWVVIRLVSRSAAGNGIAYFDTVTVT